MSFVCSQFVRNDRIENAFSTMGRNNKTYHQHPPNGHSDFSINPGMRINNFGPPEVPSSTNYYPRYK